VRDGRGRIHGSKASDVCCDRPRTRHTGILTEVQLRELMILPLNSDSIVNQ
jgi:hypothetical protein